MNEKLDIVNAQGRGPFPKRGGSKPEYPETPPTPRCADASLDFSNVLLTLQIHIQIALGI